MRKDEQGNVVTLEEDIKRIWSAHGMEVMTEEVKDLKSIDPSLEGFVWTIHAKPKSKLVEFTPPKRELLRARHRLAVANGEKQFEFENNTYLTDYAKYVLQYLDSMEVSK
jgi:hypothetical protein